MNFPHLRSRPTRPRAFTLIELLVVITIIAVLAGLLLPVTQRVIENSRKASTKSTEANIIAAVNAYQTEYGQYPAATSDAGAATNDTPKDTTYGVDKTNNHNHYLFDVLRAINDVNQTPVYNSRRIVYFESKNVKSTTNPRDGFIVTGNPQGNLKSDPVVTLQAGDLVDPWGNMYCVRIDTGYTNCVLNPYKDATTTANDLATEASDPNNQDVLRTGVISWTWGADGKEGNNADSKYNQSTSYAPTPGDDVDSWQ